MQTDPLNTESVACKKRGNEFLAQGRLQDAAECYRQAVAVNPQYAEGFLNLGFVLKEQGLYAEAEACLKQAVLINPELEDAFYLLGALSQERGNLAGAAENYNKTLELKPDFEIVYRDLCQVLFESGQNESAKSVIKQGLSLNPESAEFHCYLGNLYVHEKKFDKAIACYRKSLSVDPEYAVVYSNMGKAFIEQGKIDEAIDCYRKAVSLDSESVAVGSKSSLLFLQNYYPRNSPAQYLADAKHYGSEVLSQAKPYASWPACPTNGRRLRVGLVSGDLMGHPVGYFLESILAHLNPSRIELVAYPTQPQEDDLTSRIKPYFSAWNSVAGLNDEAAAQKIHSDGIHILVDLAGHTTHHRLPVFAWKPAPVQVNWLGYFASTGVPGMDYLLADPISVPESQREQFTETVWYLPDTRLCFTPPESSAALTPMLPPSVRKGFITFGCFQNVSKINDEVLGLWARIFHSLPQARLRLQSKQMDCPAACEQMLRRLAQAGIAQHRVVIEGPMPRENYLAAHAEVDIILDTFPYPGGTTTCEALWMGVPTLTLAGNTMLARQGASMLACAGLEEWIASNEEEYVARALFHAADVSRLAQLRSGLREQILASPLFDARRFAQHLEDALHGMWQHSHALNSWEHNV
ncbi:tetratricopeptide repeat protein [Sulfurimicrobium lacus]|uniref:O-linked N-acetylglucosamine transferase, SPINDLY family protein n=1 Tax=Sulfurimicrobium lacus TaxID=2715678 RepID=UPI0015635D7A|nr:tetratricopeptide repeat protein [Sulfurimicrobium lacus]